MESAVTLLGNASSQMSGLRRQKVLKEYNKDLLSFTKEREATFIKAAPLLFGPQFLKDTADHLEQVAALKRAKSSSGHDSGFQKAPSPQWSSHQPYAPRQRPKPYTRPKAANARNYTFMSKAIDNSESYCAESVKHGVSKSSKGKGAFKGDREVSPVFRYLEGVDQGHLGIEYHKRVCNSLEREALSKSKTLRRGILKRSNSSSERRDKIIVREGCHLPLQGGQQFLLN